MGMYDDVRCLYPLPVEGANERDYQTKSLDCTLDNYEIREDGSLWHENYEIEDHSDPNETGLMRLKGMLARVNKRWEPEPYTGEIRFHDWDRNADPVELEFSAYFVDGQLRELHHIKE